jgi:hypothetical protein
MEQKTSQQWWDSIKLDSTKLIEWLKSQYHGKILTAQRIRESIVLNLEPDDNATRNICNRIAREEEAHALWIRELLANRGRIAEILDRQEHYWDFLTPIPKGNAEYAVGVAAHAQQMHLDRIKIIIHDESTYTDVRDTFRRIYKDEVFHARAFKNIANTYYNEVSAVHARELEPLSLIL